MYVIFPAVDVVDESYLALVAQENETPPATGLRGSPAVDPSPSSPAPPTFHDTRPEQERAEALIALQNASPDAEVPRLTQLQPPVDRCARPDTFYGEPGLPDLVPTGPPAGVKQLPDVSKRQYLGRVATVLPLAGQPDGAMCDAVAPPTRRIAVPIRDLVHPSINDALKSHQQVTFRLVKSASDFTHSLSKLHEQHAEDLHSLVEEFRAKNADLRNERMHCGSTLFNAWESLLNETECGAQAHTDIAGVLGRSVSRPLLEKTFHMKIQSRTVFLHRESFETILEKTEQMLLKCHDDYSGAFDCHARQNNAASATALTEAHNNYVQQLHAANGMVDQYYRDTLPHLLQQLDDVYHDVSGVMAETLVQAADVIALKSAETARRHENLARVAKQINPPQDLNAFVKTLNIPEAVTVSKHVFALPHVSDPSHLDSAPPLRDEIVVDRATQNAARNRYDTLKKEASELEVQNRQLAEALDTMIRIQARSLESQLFNKANELQEDISLKRFDQMVALLHLAAIRAQKEMFASKVDGASGATGNSLNAPAASSFSGGGGGGGGGGFAAPGIMMDPVRERKLSSGSGSTGGGGGGGMKNKWVKAFKSIKGNKEQPEERVSKNGKDIEASSVIENAHIFQEYTYKKITPCDICSQILRGHTRQGLKCKLCRMNVHPDCQDGVPKCQPKSRLLRRQKSASEIDSRIMDDDRYARQDEAALGIARGPRDYNDQYGPPRGGYARRPNDTNYNSSQPRLTYGHEPRPYGSAATLQVNPNAMASSTSAPSSPVQNRRLLSARNARMSSVEMPDDNEKSVSSASTSPCHSPKSHHRLPNLHVVLFNFKPRHADELELKAGYKISVLDASDKDWWKGKCLGGVGVFPSTYVAKLGPREKPLQVLQSVNIPTTHHDGLIKLLRDQIVIQVDAGYSRDSILIRTAEHRQGHCPLQYLQEV